MIKGVGCIEVPVLDMQKSVVFYEKVLGLKKVYEHPVWTSFDVGGTTFALAASGTKGTKEGTEVCKSCSLCVLRFASGGSKRNVPTATSIIYLEVENLDATYSRLKESGVKFVTEPKKQGWGGRTAVMLDPDKNLLVLTE